MRILPIALILLGLGGSIGCPYGFDPDEDVIFLAHLFPLSRSPRIRGAACRWTSADLSHVDDLSGDGGGGDHGG